LIDFSAVDEGPVPGAKIAYIPSTVEKDLRVAAAGTVICDRNLVGGSAANDQRAAGFQTKNVGPSRPLPNYEVGGTIVLLHREWLEITLENVRAVAASSERETVPDFSSSYGGKSKADDPQ
jgi:hypothetical protein